MTRFPRTGPVRDRLEYLWGAFVDWGVAHPQRLNVLDQLSVAIRSAKNQRRSATNPDMYRPGMIQPMDGIRSGGPCFRCCGVRSRMPLRRPVS
ncbi:MAG: hypothetical protein CBARDCOR_4504 [uncultured Caballeronia sp.]|nr:MAG: hypothetical protein CBARDCOR_4504 [uncultured Caballeronia sp.]